MHCRKYIGFWICECDTRLLNSSMSNYFKNKGSERKTSKILGDKSNLWTRYGSFKAVIAFAPGKFSSSVAI